MASEEIASYKPISRLRPERGRLANKHVKQLGSKERCGPMLLKKPFLT